MYGLVNKAVEELAIELGGPELWHRIAAEAGLDVSVFVDMETYPDDITYRLVEAASRVLDMPAEAILEAFGRHWILYTGRRGYGGIFDTMGHTLPEFLMNLDAMHARLRLSMPDLRPPSFVCEIVEGGELRLQYWSERVGLAPMVVGLLRGLGELFDVDVSVTHTQRRGIGSEYDEFSIIQSPRLVAVSQG